MKKKKLVFHLCSFGFQEKEKHIWWMPGAIPIENEKKKLYSGHQMHLLSIQMKKNTWWPPSLLYPKKKRNRLVPQGTILNMEEK